MNETEQILIAYNDGYLMHDPGQDHLEQAHRVKIVLNTLSKPPLNTYTRRTKSRIATPEEAAMAHNPKYVEAIRRICDAGGQYLASMEANLEVESYEGALFSAGGGLTLADEIMAGNARVGFAPNRPPGHHAVYDRPKGLCIFNNMVILARYLQKKFSVGKIGIIDFDVHHGNGTEDAFWHDEDILFCSIHQDNLFPYDKGLAKHIGEGKGEGFTINIPMPKKSTDEDYFKAFNDVIVPAFKKFDADIMLVSAGFDAHQADNIGGMRLSKVGFQQIGSHIMEIADTVCEGKVITIMEGGYHELALMEGVAGYLTGLGGFNE